MLRDSNKHPHMSLRCFASIDFGSAGITHRRLSYALPNENRKSPHCSFIAHNRCWSRFCFWQTNKYIYMYCTTQPSSSCKKSSFFEKKENQERLSVLVGVQEKNSEIVPLVLSVFLGRSVKTGGFMESCTCYRGCVQDPPPPFWGDPPPLGWPLSGRAPPRLGGLPSPSGHQSVTARPLHWQAYLF